MNESISIAFSVAQKCLGHIESKYKLNCNKQFFQDNLVHMHFPEGAVPKDGPSAGVVMTVALV